MVHSGHCSGELINCKIIWYLILSICILILIFFVEVVLALTRQSGNAFEGANRLCDELELNDYLTVILARGGAARIQSITWKGLESRLSHRTHQRADSRMTSSFPLILKESRMGTSGLRCSVNPNAVLECPHPSSSLEFSPTLTLSSPSFLASALDSQLLFPPLLSQLAEKLRPLRVSIDLMNEIVPLSWQPWNLVRSHSRCLHTYTSTVGGREKKTLVASQTVR